MGAELNGNFSKKYIHIAIGMAIMLIFGFLPPVDPITPIGMRVIGVFIGTLYLWCMVDMLWPSFFAIIMTAFIGYTSIAQAVSSSLGNSLVWMFIAIYALFGGMDQIGYQIGLLPSVCRLNF